MGAKSKCGREVKVAPLVRVRTQVPANRVDGSCGAEDALKPLDRARARSTHLCSGFGTFPSFADVFQLVVPQSPSRLESDGAPKREMVMMRTIRSGPD